MHGCERLEVPVYMNRLKIQGLLGGAPAEGLFRVKKNQYQQMIAGGGCKALDELTARRSADFQRRPGAAAR